VRFLRGELVDARDCPIAGTFTGGLDLGPSALGKRLDSKPGEHLVSDP
jgi:hypothetical protein